MSLGVLIDALKAFDCPAFRDMEVTHYFADKNLYSFKEDVKGVAFDTVNRKIVLICEDPEQFLWDGKNLMKP